LRENTKGNEKRLHFAIPSSGAAQRAPPHSRESPGEHRADNPIEGSFFRASAHAADTGAGPPRAARSTALPATVAAAAGVRGAEGPDGIAAAGEPHGDPPRTRVRLPAAPQQEGAAPECRPRAPPRRGVLTRPGGDLELFHVLSGHGPH